MQLVQVVDVKLCYKAKMCCENKKDSKMTKNESAVEEADALVDGLGVAVVSFLRHTKLLSWSVPLEVNVTKLTLAPATLSVIHVWYSDTRA